MSGRHVRQFREAKARMAALPPCDCGAGLRRSEDGTKFILTPHEIGACAFLRAIAKLSARHICTQCGFRYRCRIRLKGPFRFSAGHCPNGHGSFHTWEYRRWNQ